MKSTIQKKLSVLLLATLFFSTLSMATGPRISAVAMTVEKNEIFALDLPLYISTEITQGGVLSEIVRAAFDEAKMEVYITTVPLQSMIKYYYAQENAPGFLGRHLGLDAKKISSLVRIPLLIAHERYFYYKPLHPKGLEFEGKLSNLKGLIYGAAKGQDVTLYKNAGIKVKKSRTLSLFKKLKDGTIDFISMPKESAQWFLAKRYAEDKNDFVMMKEESEKVDISLYFNMNNLRGKKMKKAFIKGLRGIIENGKYAAILEKHLTKDEVQLQTQHINKYIK